MYTHDLSPWQDAPWQIAPIGRAAILLIVTIFDYNSMLKLRALGRDHLLHSLLLPLSGARHSVCKPEAKLAMELNPYQSPAGVPEPRSAASRVKAPAISLIVTSSLWFVYVTFAAVMNTPMVLENFQNDASFGMAIALGFYLPPLWIFAVLWGSIQMLRLRDYTSARLAAWLALAPLCGPCALLGIPLGGWALAVLARSDVKEAFRASSYGAQRPTL